MTDNPAHSAPHPHFTRRDAIRAWPLAAAVVGLVGAGALALAGVTGMPVPWAEPSLLLLALSALACGAIALAKSEGVDGSEAVVGVAAASAVLLALGATAAPSLEPSTLAFAFTSPARYALTPIAVHLAFAIGWPHRHRYWFGVVTGWYLIHLAMWVAVVGGLIAEEAPLVRALDGTFRQAILEPVGTVIALAAAGIAAVSPARRASERRAALWSLGAIALGMIPLVAIRWLDGIDQVALEGLRAIDLSLVAFPLLALVGLSTLPFLDGAVRDSRALALAQRVLDEGTIHDALNADCRRFAAGVRRRGRDGSQRRQAECRAIEPRECRRDPGRECQFIDDSRGRNVGRPAGPDRTHRTRQQSPGRGSTRGPPLRRLWSTRKRVAGRIPCPGWHGTAGAES